ncbi:MAG: molybdate ABC transporter permease subunit [Lachnospiraceae bacterium]|nr:molybdate ABC transporter permease subunit [Lachnospiraceae bacterium]
MDISPLLISLKIAAASSVITFFLGILAARLVISMSRGKYLVDGLLSLPLVLPPTVVGFFLLVLLGKNSAVGSMLSAIGVEVIFTWQGAVIAAVVVSFPVMYRTARGALEQVDENLIYAARTLGMGEVKIFFRIMLPAAWQGIAAAVILAFARALGEFGATIMIAGNLPGKTRTMSIAVYTAMQSGNRKLAFCWVMIILSISLLILLLMNYWTDAGIRKRKQG